MGFHLSIKKPLGGSNSFANRTISKPIPTLVGTMTGSGPMGGVLGAGFGDMQGNFNSKMDEYKRQLAGQDQNAANSLSELEQMAQTEEQKRQALGLKQQQQILGFANEQEGRAKDYRSQLANSLSQHGQQFFNQMNPQILEDLNSRGLFTSQTARDQSQASALKDIELANQNQLMNFDTQSFNDINDIRGTGLSAMLGGDQSALDSALELRKAGIQRKFDEQDAQREQTYAEMLAKRKSRDDLMSSILGLGGKLGGAAIGRDYN